jgi:hypothetical protein
MSSAIGPGDWVRCVENGPHRVYGWVCPLSKGQLYTVRGLYGGTGLLLKEVRWSESDAGFLPERFTLVPAPYEPPATDPF